MLTSSQLIRLGALNTKSIEIKPGKIITYKDEGLEEVKDNVCWLCGGEINKLGMPTKERIKDTFTDHSWARGQGSQSLCPGCVLCLSMRELRNYSIVATENMLIHPGRAQLKEILLLPPEPPFVVCIAVSGQKHISFKAPVNYSREIFEVMLEEQLITVSPVKLKKVLEIVEKLYMYFTKDEISTGRYSLHRIQQMGLEEWQKVSEELELYRKTRLFELALFIAQKQEPPENFPIKEVRVCNAEKQTSQPGNKVRNQKITQLGFQW